jgi:hypothetical protein
MMSKRELWVVETLRRGKWVPATDGRRSKLIAETTAGFIDGQEGRVVRYVPEEPTDGE